jgi:predicted dehydrogenase
MIKTSVVGYGYFGDVYVRRLEENPLFELVSIVENGESKQAAVALGLPVFDHVDGALDHGADLVVVCTPADDAANIAIAALSRSTSVLLCKPGAVTLKEAQHVVRTARENNAIVMVDYTPRNTSAWKHLRLEQPRLPMQIKTARYNTGNPRHDVCVILDLAAHDISLICDLTPRRLFVTNAWTALNGNMAGITITDNDIMKANVSVQRSAVEARRLMLITNGWSTTSWDQINGIITAGAGRYWETVITHDTKDPVTIQLNRTAKALQHKIDDDSGIFLRVMDVLDQALQLAKENTK